MSLLIGSTAYTHSKPASKPEPVSDRPLREIVLSDAQIAQILIDRLRSIEAAGKAKGRRLVPALIMLTEAPRNAVAGAPIAEKGEKNRCAMSAMWQRPGLRLTGRKWHASA